MESETNILVISEYNEMEYSESSGTDDELDKDIIQDITKKSDLPSEYWNVQKLLKYMKAGNQTATVIALACLKDQDFKSDITLAAIRDIGGLEILVNLLETNDHKCIFGSLSVLSQVSHKQDAQKQLTELGAVQLLVNLLKGPDHDLQCLAANIIYYAAKTKKARNIVRKCGGIPILVDLLDVRESLLVTPTPLLDEQENKVLGVVRESTRALWSLSQSRRIKEQMRTAGCVKLLARLLSCVHDDIVEFTMGIIEQCCTESNYQLDIQSEGMMNDMVRFLPSDNAQLKKHCASAIYKCAEDESTRKLVRENGGLDPLIGLIRDPGNREDKALLSAATGAVWKCAACPDNVRRLNELNTINVLVDLLNDEDEEVLKNIAGALSECARLSHNRETICKAGGIDSLVGLLNLTNSALLENVTQVLGECAKEKECMARIEELDGVRLIWSLLKNKSTSVQAKAAWALVPCIKNSSNSGEMVRSLVGGLELMVSLLKSNDNGVLAGICAALANVAQVQENLAVITDHGVVPLLCRLVNTEDSKLQEYLALAIAHCCSWGKNCYEFGRLGAVGPLVSYMASNEKGVHKSTALALHRLSQDPFNCVTLHQSGVVPYLLVTIASSDEHLQQASAGCLSNIRKLALTADNLQ